MSIIARNFGKLFFLALIGGLALGAVMAQRGMQVDLGRIGGIKLALAAPAVTKTPAVPAGLFPSGTTTTGTTGQAPSASTTAPVTGTTFVRPTTGTVQAVAGKTISVTAQDGTVTKATVSDTTTFVKDSAITAADIKVGDSVTVIGQAGSDGTIAATQLTVGAAGQASAAGAGGFLRQGGTGAAGRGGTGAGGQFANLSIVTGTVQKIDGTTLTVAVEGGQATNVTLGTNARLQKMAAATLADVTTGVQVTIAGQAGADGTIAAVSVQIGAAR